jgi:hypothetical protein
MLEDGAELEQVQRFLGHGFEFFFACRIWPRSQGFVTVAFSA